MRRDLQRFIVRMAASLALAASVAALGCRGSGTEAAVGPHAFRQAQTPQRSWNPFTKESVAHNRSSEQPPDWRSLQAMMPEDTISLSKPLEPGADLFVKAAALFELRGQYPQAIEQYHKALEKDEQDVAALIGLARLLDRMDRSGEAEQIYARAAQFHPQNSTVFNDLGLSLSKQQRWDAAIAQLNRAIQLQPDNRLYRNNLAKVLVMVGRSDQAVQQLIGVLTPAEAHFNVAYLANELGDPVRAQHHLAAALQVDPGFVEAQSLLAELQNPAHGTPTDGRPSDWELTLQAPQPAPGQSESAFGAANNISGSGIPGSGIPGSGIPGSGIEQSGPSPFRPTHYQPQ